MIPRRIFQTWLGDGVPPYALLSHEAFKSAYPGYEVEFVRRSSAEIRRVAEGRGNGDIDEVLARAVRQAQDPALEYVPYVTRQRKFYAARPSSFIMVVCDLFRLELLNAFGGIYVDADALPGRQFDDEILCLDRFCVCRLYSGRVLPDNYFIGQAEGMPAWTNPMDSNSATQVRDPQHRDAQFQIRKAMFAAGRSYVAPGMFYVEHYMVRSWDTFGGRAVDFVMGTEE